MKMDETAEDRKSDSFSRTDTAAGAQRPGIELLIGSNIFRNTNGVIGIHGKEQLVLESRDEQGLLLVTIDLYDQTGAHIAHVRRNVLVLNQTGRFAMDVHQVGIHASDEAPAVRILDRHSGTLIFEAGATSKNKIQITVGKLYSHKGIAVEITPHYCRIGSGMTRFGDVVETRGNTVILG